MENRTVEGRRRPRPAHVGAHVGGVGTVVGAAEAPGSVVLPAVRRDVQGAAVGGGHRVPGRGDRAGQWRTGGEGEPRRHR